MRRFWLILAGCLLLATAAQASAPGPGFREQLARLPVVRGDDLSADALAGRVVAVVFFASWCPPCRVEFPHLNTVQRAYGERGFQVVAVNVFERWGGLSTPAKLARFLDEVRPAFPVVRGDRAIRGYFDDLDRIPSLFVFDRAGRLAAHFRHARNATKTHLSEAELRAAVAPLL